MPASAPSSSSSTQPRRSYPYISHTDQPSTISHVRPSTSIPSLPSSLTSNTDNNVIVLPQLPSPIRAKTFIPGYELSTHIIPSAHPRLSSTDPLRFRETSSSITLNDFPSPSSSSSSDKKKVREWAMQKSKSLIEKRKAVFEKLERGDVQDGLLVLGSDGRENERVERRVRSDGEL